jgi:nucleoside-diphosphate-sugar epimerase
MRAEDQMTSTALHVVFGTGQVGRALVERLAGLGLEVRAVSRHRPDGLSKDLEWRSADASYAEAATEAATGATVIYQCLNASYTEWPTMFPPLQHGVLMAAEHTGALLVSFENVYGYGPTGGRPMTEDLPLAATTVKGRTRVAMTHDLLSASEVGRVRIAIGRAADLFGAGVTESALGRQFFPNAVAGKKVDFIGDPDLLHTYSYVPDVAAALAVLGTDERAVGQVWHLPGPETVSTRTIVAMVETRLGHSVGIRVMPRLALRAMALVNPMMRGLAEMAYEFDEPFVLDTTKFRTTFGGQTTPLDEAIATTVDAFRRTAEMATS